MKKRILTALFVAAVAISTSAQWLPAGQEVPAHHTAPPAKGAKLPPILKPSQLSPAASQYAFQKHSYVLAAKASDVIYQQPCLCHCDKGQGHTSLRSCFESEHGAHCSICMKEAIYSYQQTKKGRTPAQIRAGILAREADKIPLEGSEKIQ